MMRRVEEEVRGGPGNFFDMVTVDHDPGFTGIVMSLGRRFPTGWVGNCTLVIEQPPEDKAAIHPARVFHSLSEGEAQALIDALFKAGVRPTGYGEPAPAVEQETFAAGKVEAMKDHLADLRRLVFRDPPPEPPLGPDEPRTGRGEVI